MGTAFILFCVFLFLGWLCFLYSVRLYRFFRIAKAMRPVPPKRRQPSAAFGESAAANGECRPVEFTVRKRHSAFKSVLLKRKKHRHEEMLTLRGEFLNPDGPRLLIFVHEEGRSRSQVREKCRPFIESGWAVLAYDQRAHGASDGKRFTLGYCESEDLARIAGEVTAEKKYRSVGFYGVGCGAAAALLALDRSPKIDFIVAEDVWPSYTELIQFRIRRSRLLRRFDSLILEFLLRNCEKYLGLPLRDMCPLYAAINHSETALYLIAGGKVAPILMKRIAENRLPEADTHLFFSKEEAQPALNGIVKKGK